MTNQKWDYWIETSEESPDSCAAVNRLIELGTQGWELVGVIHVE